MGLDAKIIFFWMLSFKPAFPLSSLLILVYLYLLSLEWYHLHEIVPISPDSLISRLFFIQPGISRDVLCLEVE